MTKRVAISKDGFVEDVNPVRVAVDGFVRTIGRALVAKDGLAREFYPTDDVDPNQIFWTAAPEAGSDIEIVPTTAQVFLELVVASGQAFLTKNGVTTFIGYFLRPPTTSTGQFLVRVDVNSGSIIGDTTGAWLDIHVSGPGKVWSWQIDQATVAFSTADIDVSISQDSGGGVPDAGTTIVKNVTMYAEQVGDDLRWSEVKRNLDSTTINAVAECELRFETDGNAFGEAVTSGAFTEQWSDGPNAAYTVQVDLISGTAPTGDALGAPLTLDQLRLWELIALAGEDLSCTLDVTVDGGAAGSTKKAVTMHSMRTDTDSSVVWTTTPVDIIQTILGEPLTLDLVSLTTGIGEFQLQGDPASPPEDWHSDAPSPLDQTDYEVRLRRISGDLPEGFDVVDTWLNAGTGRRWRWQITTGGGVQNRTAVVEWGYRRLGESGTEVLKIVTIDVTGGT